MQLRHKIAQMLIIGFSGCEIDENSQVVQWLKKDGLGGVLLFDLDLPSRTYGKNIKNKQQIIQLNQALNHYAITNAKDDTALPLLIAIDYEGGVVDRLASVPDHIKTMTAVEQAALSDDALSIEAKKMAETLKQLGFNLNFAPVVDLDLNQQEGIIGKLGRSFSSSSAAVIRAAQLFIQAFNQQGIACAYKHFPGHGSAIGDTHEGFVDVTEYFQIDELKPYETLLQDVTQPNMVMTAHVVNRQLDPSGLPATLSHTILTDLLRKKLGFNGVVISDDLQMQAITHHYSLDEALCLTINAGADMIIFGNQWGEHEATDIIDRIEYAVQSGAIPLMRIDEAYQRIMMLKQRLISLFQKNLAK